MPRAVAALGMTRLSVAPTSSVSPGHALGGAGAMGGVVYERPGFVAQLRSGGLCTDAICPFHVHSHQRTFVLEVMGRHCG